MARALLGLLSQWPAFVLPLILLVRVVFEAWYAEPRVGFEPTASTSL